jgi:intein/homing endonuclease
VIQACRICGCTELDEVLDLGDQALSGIFPRPNTTVEFAPLRLVRCRGECGLVQLADTADLRTMYGMDYGYRSGLNQSMVTHLGCLAQEAQRLVALRPGDVVLDIGSNDGTTLSFYPADLRRIGVDPTGAKFRRYYQPGIELVPDFFSAELMAPLLNGHKAKVVTTFSMFYDLPKPLTFMREVAWILHDDGVWLMEQSYLPAMMRANAVDTVCFKPDTIIQGSNKAISAHVRDDPVLGITGAATRVTSTMRRSYKGPMVCVKPSCLEPVTATPEHPVYLVRADKVRFRCGQQRPIPEQDFSPEWVPIKEVRKGDYVAVPRLKEGSGSEVLDLRPFHVEGLRHSRRRGLDSVTMSEDLAWFMGLYVAEGFRVSPKHGGIVFSLHEDEVAYVERVRGIARRLGYKTSVYGRKQYGSKGIDVKVQCASLGRALHAWCGAGLARDKRIPEVILRSSAAIRRQFLIGLFDGDGYIKNNQVHLHTASHILALQTQLLIASLGAVVGITYADGATSTRKDGQVIRGGPSWQLRGKSPALMSLFGVTYVRGGHGPAARYHVTDDFVFVPVTSVSTEAYDGDVCNIETGNHTYLVSNAVVHNCHEHLEYYSLRQIEWMAERCGLHVTDAYETSTNGGSFVVKLRKGLRNVNLGMRASEKLAGLHRASVYSAFALRARHAAEALREFLEMARDHGKVVAGLGASTKGNVLLQMIGADTSLISCIGDVNPDKHGCVTPGTNIPIISEDAVLAANPDFLIVLPWHFKPFFLSSPKFNGRTLLFPLPQLEIVTP